MATYYDKASLVMIPSGYKDDKLYSIKPTDGSGDFTFSRDDAGASPATRVNASGLIEKGRENLLIQSNAFDNASWTKTRATLTGGQSGYDGSSDAWAFVDDTNNSTHLLYQSLSSLGAEVATMSVYAKAGDVNFIAFRFEGAAVDYAYFDLANGTLGTIDSDYIEARITDVGGDWYRCEATRVLAASGNQAIILPAQTDNDPTYAGAGTTAIYIQDAQVELGLIATSVIETTTAPVSAGLLGDMPRLDYSGGATCPSLLLEPSRVNVLANSEYIGGSGWTKLASTTSYNEITTPEGVDNSVKLKPNNGITFSIPASGIFTAGASSYVRSNGITLTATDYTFSAFVKKGDFDHLQLRSGTDVDLTANATTNLINLNDGTASVANSVEDFGNGWYRVSLTFTATAATWYVGFWFWNTTSVTANGSQGIYAYGAQLEAGSYPTSYIPTYGSAAPRAADSCSKTGISSLIGQTEGTLFVEFKRIPKGENYQAVITLQGASAAQLIEMYFGTTDALLAAVYNSGAQFQASSGGLTEGTYKAALAYKENDFAFYLNGSQIATDSSGTIPALSTINVGGFTYVSGYPQADGIKQTLLFKTRLTNAELAALTTL